MSKAKCFKCGASATADTFEQARKKLNHAVGLSRGIKCGDNYGRVQEIKELGGVRKSQVSLQKDTIKTEIPKEEPKIESSLPEIEPEEEKPKKEKATKKSQTKKE